MIAPHDNAAANACPTCNGTPLWCPVHGDMWYDDDGDVHFGAVPPEVMAERKAFDDEATGSRPLEWEFPLFGLRVQYVDDAGHIVTMGLR